MRIARRLVESGEMAYGGLGVEIEERERGVLVTWVQPDGPAFNAGWKKGDLILSYDGRPVAGAYHLRRMVNETTPGTSVMLEVERDNAPVIASVTVGEMMKGTSVGQTVSQAGGSEVVVRRIASLEQKLGGLRSYLEDGTSSSLSMQMFGNPGDRRSGNDGGFLRPQKTIVSQQIDELEREIGRLRRILRGQ
jgi:C-terminal processing protease CtpA/Prc